MRAAAAATELKKETQSNLAARPYFKENKSLVGRAPSQAQPLN